MKMAVLRKMEYKADYRIHIMQFGTIFQYLITDKQKNLYQDHVSFKPKFIRSILFKLGFLDSLYTKEELEAGEGVLLAGAIKSIDALITDLKRERKGKLQIAEVAQQHKKTADECSWRAVTSDEGSAMYECLTHPGHFSEMIDGQRPYHKDAPILSPIQFEEAQNNG